MPALLKFLRLFRDTAIIALVTLGLLTTVELAIRWIAPQDVRHEYREGGSIGVPDPRLGHVYRPGAVSAVHAPEFSVEYRINAEGLRDETAHPSPRSQGSQRILVLGDSFAFGAGNAYDKIWPVLLEQQLLQRGHQVDVVKAGVSAYDTAKEALYLERLFPRYEPDIVLLAFLPNDLFTNQPIVEDVDQTPRDNEEQAVRAQEELPFQLHTVLLAKRMLIAGDLLYSKLYLATPRGQYFSSPPGERLTGQLALTRALLARIQRFCEEHAATLVVLSIPQQFQVIARANGYEFDGFDPYLVDGRFAEYAREDGYVWIPGLDALAQAYRAGEADLYYRLDGHLTNTGNAVVAEVAANGVAGLLVGTVNAEPGLTTREQDR